MKHNKCSYKRKTIFQQRYLAEDFVRQRAEHVTLRIYECEFCGGYHVTKQPLPVKDVNLVHRKEFEKYLNQP